MRAIPRTAAPTATSPVTAIVPHCEMGQGAHTTLAQMLADELDADWAKVSVMQAPADGNYVVPDAARDFVAAWSLDAPKWLEPTYNGLFTQISKLGDVLVTGGSSSVRTTGQHTMRLAGAAARQMLVAAAAARWNVPASEIVAENSTLVHKASNKRGTYGEFAEAASQESMPQTPPLKDVSQYKLMGKGLQRFDIPAKVNGEALFGIDAQVPGQKLKYVAVKAPPVPGAKVEAINSATAKARCPSSRDTGGSCCFNTQVPKVSNSCFNALTSRTGILVFSICSFSSARAYASFFRKSLMKHWSA